MARAQYGALAAMRWSIFRNSMRTSRGALELGARGLAYLIYCVHGLRTGGWALGAAPTPSPPTESGQCVPVLFWVAFFVWQMVPVSMASFQEQFDLGGLLRFPVSFGAFYLLHLVFGLVDVSTIMGGFCCLGIWIGI